LPTERSINQVALRYEIRGSANAQTLSRLINFFAQLGMTPTRVRADKIGQMLMIVIEQDGLDDHQADVIAYKMRSSVMVEDVRLTRLQAGTAL